MGLDRFIKRGGIRKGTLQRGKKGREPFSKEKYASPCPF
jgi:hypothetical protein